jgi:hypothetical protein
MSPERQTGRGARPYSLRHTLQNPLARMLPLNHWITQVYRMGERRPPSGGLDGYGPTWECVSMVLTALGTSQVRVSLQREFTLLGLNVSTSSNVSGGFRAQLYDVNKQVRLADRGVQQALLGGTDGEMFFLREPYAFPQPNSQILVMVQNLEAVQNTIQLVLYGVALPFNAVHANAREFPGGPVSSTAAPTTRSGQ